MASTLVLQGCDIFGGSGSGGSSSKEGQNGEATEKETDWGKLAEIDSSSTQSEFAHDEAWCREQVSRNSETFQRTVEGKAPKYYEALTKVFTEDYVKYPFCLENRRYQVWKTQRALRKDPTSAELAGDDFETAVEGRIQKNFRNNQGDYETFCQEWSHNNVAYQTSNLPAVAQILSLEPEAVKEELEGFFHWQTWWIFFEAMQTSGCMTKYVDMCAPAVKVAHRHALELVRQTTGDPQMHWLYYEDNPHDVLGIASSSLVQRETRSRQKENVMPVELRPTGHMLLRH